ncbi:hypothetical protein DVH24_022016 [Malus domestica]|uniref:Uncharacterized protein n=1 Tax=Malus domestica TaxID=3750 RepID=A0A498IZ01_MALDO|nr:hypothetical protein DVH24_022016 [Malus domestica]
MYLICTYSPPYSTRSFGSSLVLVSSRESNHMMDDLLRSSCVSSHKQNCEDVLGVQYEQYRATAELSPGYGGARARM